MQTADSGIANENNSLTNPSDTLKQLENLIAESLQLYELENQKSNITDDLVNSLRIITEYLGFSVNIHPGIFELPANTNIVLLPTLDVIIRKSNGKTEQKRLDQFSPEQITKILQYVMPLTLTMIQKEKGYLTEKISFLRSATQQLKQLQYLKNNDRTNTQVPIEGAEEQNV